MSSQPSHEVLASNDYIDLSRNESPYEIKVSGIVTAGLNRYIHKSHQQLLAALAKHHSVDQDQIILGHGSSHVLEMFIEKFGRRGGVAALNPSYHEYRTLTEKASIPYIDVPSNEQMRLDPKPFLSFARGAGLQIIANPNNPTGVYEEIDSTLKEVIQGAQGVTAIDETYIEFAGKNAKSATELLKDVPDKAVVIRSFSKAYAGANGRIGYAVMGKEVECPSSSLQPISGVQEQIALQLLKKTDEVHQKVADVIAWRDIMEIQLTAIGCNVMPSRASFILFGLPEGTQADKTHQQLIRNHQIKIRSMQDTPRLENMLRVSIGTPEENAKFIEAMKIILQKN